MGPESAHAAPLRRPDHEFFPGREDADDRWRRHECAADQTILAAANENNISIPTLCHLDGLSDVGACRLCVVEVKGTKRLLPSCITVVEEGMEVTTESGRLKKYRRMTLELLFAERNHVCSVCVSNGACELQDAGPVPGSYSR